MKNMLSNEIYSVVLTGIDFYKAMAVRIFKGPVFTKKLEAFYLIDVKTEEIFCFVSTCVVLGFNMRLP